MTTLFSWLSVDNRGPSSIYIVSDSRITWGSSGKRWDSGRKVFATKSADIFGYCGEVLFPSLVLSQLGDLIDRDILWSSDCAAENRHSKIDARYNKKELQQRCNKLAEYKDRIIVSGLDGLQFIQRQDAESTFFFIDPPYYAKGKTLYLNALDDEYHRALAAQLRAMKDAAWVLTYDDCPEIRKMYRDWARIRPFSLRYSATERRQGREIMIVPEWMRLPSVQGSAAIGW
jgi:hypothetical protein